MEKKFQIWLLFMNLFIFLHPSGRKVGVNVRVERKFQRRSDIYCHFNLNGDSKVSVPFQLTMTFPCKSATAFLCQFFKIKVFIFFVHSFLEDVVIVEKNEQGSAWPSLPLSFSCGIMGTDLFKQPPLAGHTLLLTHSGRSPDHCLWPGARRAPD